MQVGPAYHAPEMVSPQTATALCPRRFRITVHGPPSRTMAADLRKGVRRRLHGLTWCFSGYRPQGGLRPGRQALRGAMAHANGRVSGRQGSPGSGPDKPKPKPGPGGLGAPGEG